jgi:hypothetical protein
VRERMERSYALYARPLHDGSTAAEVT